LEQLEADNNLAWYDGGESRDSSFTAVQWADGDVCVRSPGFSSSRGLGPEFMLLPKRLLGTNFTWILIGRFESST